MKISSEPSFSELITPIDDDRGGWIDTSDQSASTAIDTLDTHEYLSNLFSGLTGRPNALTGDDLMGAVLEGIADPGDEAQELGQMQAYIGSHTNALDESGVRAAAVVDKYLAIAESRHDGNLTQQEKAALAKELGEAARPRPWGEFGEIQPGIIKKEEFYNQIREQMGDQYVGLQEVPLGKPSTGIIVPIDEPFIEYRPDASAKTAIDTLTAHERDQSGRVFLTGGYANQTTGEELMGAVLEGVGDPGNEALELRQLQSFALENRHDLSDSGKRVAAVVDKYLAIAESQGGSLSQADKAQMAKEMAAAAERRFGDDPHREFIQPPFIIDEIDIDGPIWT